MSVWLNNLLDNSRITQAGFVHGLRRGWEREQALGSITTYAASHEHSILSCLGNNERCVCLHWDSCASPGLLISDRHLCFVRGNTEGAYNRCIVCGNPFEWISLEISLNPCSLDNVTYTHLSYLWERFGKQLTSYCLGDLTQGHNYGHLGKDVLRLHCLSIIWSWIRV
jgi:hypothetical protein